MSAARETVETVAKTVSAAFTSLKRGVNEICRPLKRSLNDEHRCGLLSRGRGRDNGAVLGLLFTWLCLPLPGQSFSTLFDGKNLEAFEPRGEAIFTVENGEIVGKTGKDGHGWLCTKRTYGDFILELEVNISSGNSGVQVRSHFGPKDK